ncbi:MAG: (d)CMP kinase [Bdellovibrionota bacterium]
MNPKAEDGILSIPKQGPVIAIDGPAGTGKSSAARRLADALHFVHVDTGALYRAIAFLTLESLAGTPESESARAVEVARSIHLEFKRLPQKNPSNRVFANGKDVTSLIRTPEVTMAASRISAIPEVRAALLGLQRRLGCAGRSILEGRDIGTVIFPDADIKFFLIASIDERTKRRLSEIEASGADAPSYEELKTQMIERDRTDSTRSVAPLKKAKEAVEVDTSQLTLDQVVSFMETEVRKRISHV